MTKDIRQTLDKNIPFGVTAALCLSCFLLLGNLYYMQPIVGDIASSLGVSPEQAGIPLALVQIGYVSGILLAVPLGDVVSPRRIIIGLCLVSAAALATLPFASKLITFSVFAGLLGFASSAMQLIVPLAIRISPPNHRGRMIGLIAAAGYFGIAGARVAASASVAFFSWKTLFWVASALLVLQTAALARVLPKEATALNHLSLSKVFTSTARLPLTVSGLPFSLLASALIFCSYTFFWTIVPMHLRSEGYSPAQVGIFSMASLITPIVAIIAGHLMDKGFSLAVLVSGTVLAVCAFTTTSIAPSLAFCLLAVFLMDPGFNMTTSVVQKNAISARPDASNRMNAAVVSGNFAASTLGAFLGPWCLSNFGWAAASHVGLGIALTSMFFGVLYAVFRHNL